MTDEIEDYTIADGTDARMLIQNVKALIEDGWQPIGGFVLVIDPDHHEPTFKDDTGECIEAGLPKFNLGQAMVKPKKRIETLN